MTTDSIDDIYASATLKAADLKGKDITLRIASYEIKNFDNGPKVVLSFSGTEKTFVVNKTNANRIAESHGKDIQGWVGKQITVYPDRVEFQGKIVDGIRVRFPKRNRQPHPQERVDELNPPFDDEVPF